MADERGHVNQVGALHRLPAVVLAVVCHHSAGTATYELTRAQLAHAGSLPAPAGFDAALRRQLLG